MIDSFANWINGNRTKQSFNIHTGSGSNSRSTLFTTINKSFGDYSLNIFFWSIFFTIPFTLMCCFSSIVIKFSISNHIIRSIFWIFLAALFALLVRLYAFCSLALLIFVVTSLAAFVAANLILANLFLNAL